MSCFVQWGVDPFRNFDLKLFFFLFINMKSTTISQVFSYLIFWGISHSCLWHFPVGCSFASSLIRFSQRSVVGNEEHTVRSGRCVLEVFSSSMRLRLWNGDVHVQHTCLFSWARHPTMVHTVPSSQVTGHLCHMELWPWWDHSVQSSPAAVQALSF